MATWKALSLSRAVRPARTHTQRGRRSFLLRKRRRDVAARYVRASKTTKRRTRDVDVDEAGGGGHNPSNERWRRFFSPRSDASVSNDRDNSTVPSKRSSTELETEIPVETDIHEEAINAPLTDNYPGIVAVVERSLCDATTL